MSGDPREDGAAVWLNRERLLAWSAIFLVVETVFFVLLALQQHGIVLPVGPGSIDFVSFYAAGKLALAGTPALAYDQAAHYLAEQQASTVGAPYVFFFYPPIFLLLCMGLATLPYVLAYVVFQAGTFALFILMLRRVLNLAGWAWIVPVIAFPATFWNIGQGQNGFLTAALFGGFGLLLDRRPVAAGAMLGALCFKPHLGLLAPIALAASRRWVAFFSAAAMVGGLVALSMIVLGWETWAAYFKAIARAEGVYASGQVNYAGFVSLFGALRLIGIAPAAAYLAQTVCGVAMAVLVASIWWRRDARPPDHAVLLAATLLAIPLALHYDQMIAVVAVAWLVGDREGGTVTVPERIVLVALYPLGLVALMIALGTQISLGFVISAAVLGLCARRALRRGSRREFRRGDQSAQQS